MEHNNEELLAALYQQYLSETVQLKEQIANLQLTIQKLQDSAAQHEADAASGDPDATTE